MPSVKRNILLKILIILISLSLFGFQDLPDIGNPRAALGNGPITDGWVEVILYGEAGGSASGTSGTGSINVTWAPAQVFMPITGYDDQARAQFQGQVFTFAQGTGIITGSIGTITSKYSWPVFWNIKGTVTPPPECLIEMTIDETWYPGRIITCETVGIIGCIPDTWPAFYAPGVQFKIPWDKAWGTSVSSGTAAGMPIHLTAIMYHVTTGVGSTEIGGISPFGCEHHVMFPVIPQAEE